MKMTAITEKDRKNAEICRNCPLCNRARKKQRGLAHLFVKYVENGICPSCAAYGRVYGRKAHEPMDKSV